MTAASVKPTELYFAVLDRPLSPRGRARQEELSYAFEASVPVPVDSVHTVYYTLPDSRILAVAIDKCQAESLAHTHTSLHPECWPDWLVPLTGGIDPLSVNLLTGPYRSRATTATYRMLICHVLIGLTLIALAVSIGLERRIHAKQHEATQAQTQASEIYSHALGPASGSLQPPLARMTSELRRLRATRGPADTSQSQSPADTVLASLLSAWPVDSQARAESITIAERTVDIVLRVNDLDAAQTFISALGGASGFRPGPTKTDREGEEIRLSIRLDRQDAP